MNIFVHNLHYSNSGAAGKAVSENRDLDPTVDGNKLVKIKL